MGCVKHARAPHCEVWQIWSQVYLLFPCISFYPDQLKARMMHACMQVCAGCADKQEAKDPLCYCGTALSELDTTDVAA